VVLPIDVKLFGIAGHAHYLAKQMTLTATLPSGEVKNVLSIADWDFGWQEQYQFANYVFLPKGTKLDSTITYDNSSANKRNPSNPPKRVTWGEQSTDEMGSIILQLVSAKPGELPQLTQAFGEHMREIAAARPGVGLLLQLGAGRGGARGGARSRRTAKTIQFDQQQRPRRSTSRPLFCTLSVRVRGARYAHRASGAAGVSVLEVVGGRRVTNAGNRRGD
jgi:hypothetical protein